MRELAVMADLPKDDRENLDKLRGYLINCGGFVTLRGNELDEDNNTVEWIDVSAQEHLEKFAKDELCLDLRDMQHGIIALRCLEYVREAYKRENADHENNDHEEAAPDPETPTVDHPNDEEYQVIDEPHPEHLWPILQYPSQNWIEHAKLAPHDIIDEFHFEDEFWQKESSTREAWFKSSGMALIPEQTKVSPLHIATMGKYHALVEYLLNHGSEDDLIHEDSVGLQPLYYAALVGEIEIVHTLLGAGADINWVSATGEVTALWGAACRGQTEVLECLIERDADINATQDVYGTPLYVAAEYEFHDNIRLLLQRGAKVNLIGGWHRLPLNVAAFNGDLETVRALLNHGAMIDPDDEDYWYGSALGAASRRGHAEVTRLLMQKGWKHDKHMKTYGSFLTAAATYGHTGVLEALLEEENRITVMEQALQAASRTGKAPIVRAILDRAPTLRHQKAFMLAASYGRNEVLNLLTGRGILQNQLDKALYDAADHEHEETVKLLLGLGANPNAEGEE